MNLLLQRLWYTARSTCGELEQYKTLELPVVDGLPGSCIPPGTYEIVLAPSPKFQQSSDPWVQRYADAMPHVVCPPRSLIMIHWGNGPTDTEGCILVGLSHDVDMVQESRAAFASLYEKIKLALAEEKVFLIVQGGAPRERAEKEQWPNG